MLCPIPKTVEQKIVEVAVAKNYSPYKALAIAKAESGFKVDARNTTSTASGVYQFLDGTFKDKCIDTYHLATSTSQKNDPDIQIECAVQMLADGGEHHWDASKDNWDK